MPVTRSPSTAGRKRLVARWAAAGPRRPVRHSLCQPLSSFLSSLSPCLSLSLTLSLFSFLSLLRACSPSFKPSLTSFHPLGWNAGRPCGDRGAAAMAPAPAMPCGEGRGWEAGTDSSHRPPPHCRRGWRLQMQRGGCYGGGRQHQTGGVQNTVTRNTIDAVQRIIKICWV